MDRTSYHPDQRDWSTDPARFPESLKKISVDRPKKEDQYTVSYMRTAQGRILLDHENHPIWAFTEIPLVLSSMFEPLYMERIRRESKASRLIAPRDFWARMPWTVTLPTGHVHEQYGSNRLSVAMTRFRETMGIAPIIKRRFSKARTKVLEDFRREDPELANGKRGLTRLQKLKVANVGLGKAPENAAARAVSEKDRKLRREEIKLKLRKLQATTGKPEAGRRLKEISEVDAGEYMEEETGEDTEQYTDDGAKEVGGMEGADEVAASLYGYGEERDAPLENFDPCYRPIPGPYEAYDAPPRDSGSYDSSLVRSEIGQAEGHFASLVIPRTPNTSHSYIPSKVLSTFPLSSSPPPARMAPVAPMDPKFQGIAHFPNVDMSSFAPAIGKTHRQRFQAVATHQPTVHVPLTLGNTYKGSDMFGSSPTYFRLDSNTGHDFECGCQECLQSALSFAEDS